MSRKIWLSPQAAATWDSLPPRLREKARAALELLTAGPVHGVPLVGPLSPFYLYALEPDLDVIYRPGEWLEILALRWQGTSLGHGAGEDKVVGLVLAAGPAEYQGLPLPLAPLHGQPLITGVTRTLQAAGVNEIIVVLGYAAETVKAKADLSGTEVVVNPHYRNGLATSLRCGLRLAQDASAVLVALADRPFIAPSSVERLLLRYRESRPPVVLPLYQQQAGHPVVFDSSLLPALQKVRRGGREVVRRYRHQVAAVPVDDEGVVREIQGVSPCHPR
ncbi:MAG: nucleotidyltransferase family protein [Clostridia bacterium]|nr:MAG: nucleotidyltransferase family protein [Clostridia bacterium]